MAIASHLRCGHVLKIPFRAWCGRPAVAVRRAPGALAATLVCAEHASLVDPLITEETIVRSVTLVCAVALVAVTDDYTAARIEAEQRLQVAALGAGAVLSIDHLHSALVPVKAGMRAFRRPPPEGEG